MIRLNRILLPTDFSDSARHAFGYALSFAVEYRAELLLLHVVEAIPAGYAAELYSAPMARVFEEMSGYARNELDKLIAEAAAQQVAARALVEEGKSPAGIVRVAREEKVDLIVLGTHGKGLLDKALFGSTTERVVRHAPCPVLTCRLSEHEAAGA